MSILSYIVYIAVAAVAVYIGIPITDTMAAMGDIMPPDAINLLDANCT